MLNAKLQSMVEDFKPVTKASLEVTVNLQCSGLTTKLANTLRGEMIRVAGSAGLMETSDISAEDICRYLSTLSWLRRVQVTHSWDKVSTPYRKYVRNVACPVIWYQILLGMGNAVDRDYGIAFKPGSTIEADDLLDPDTLSDISDVMWRLQNNGFRIVGGIPLSEEGELDFMAMCHVEDTVLSYRRTHPVYGFLASFFASREVGDSLGALVRVRYGYDSDYGVLLSRIVAGVGD